LLLLAAAVLLSFVLNADAQTPYDRLFQMHQSGPLAVPAKIPENMEYLCYSRGAPESPVFFVVEADAFQVRRMRSNSAALNRLVSGARVLLQPTRLPIFNGSLLGGRSQPLDVLESLKQSSMPSVFFGMSVFTPSRHNLAAILKIDKDQDLENACANTETLEYLCIESRDEG
jgi:hypothetical protein